MRRRKIQRKEVECNEVKEEIRWRGRSGGEKKSSRQMVIVRTAVWTKGKKEHMWKNNKVPKLTALDALPEHPHSDHYPVIYSLQRIDLLLLRYSLYTNKLSSDFEQALLKCHFLCEVFPSLQGLSLTHLCSNSTRLSFVMKFFLLSRGGSSKGFQYSWRVNSPPTHC